MSEPHRSRPPTFQPRFTLGLFYLASFFLLYCMLLIAPELSNISQPATAEQEEAVKQRAAEVAREAVRPRLPYALGLALLTTAAGGYTGVLPGLRPKS